MDNDFELLRAWQGGDNEAGDLLVRRHFWPVYRFFRNKVNQGADDLTQRTFLGCVEARDRVRAELSFRAYLFGIARKQLLFHFRKISNKSEVLRFEEVSVADIQGTPGQVMAARQEQRALLTALRRIPTDFQIAVELYYWEEMPIAEVAQVLDVAEGTVKSRLGRARKMLRDRIEQMDLAEETIRSTIQNLEGWARSLRDAFDAEKQEHSGS